MMWKVDHDVLSAAKITHEVSGDEATFTVPGFDHKVKAYMRDGVVDLVPERSHFHRVLLDRLKLHT